MRPRLYIALATTLTMAAPAPALAKPRPHIARVMKPPLPSPMPTVTIGKCPGMVGEAGGCYDQTTNTVYAISRERFPLDHEIGHAFDATRMDAPERQAFADAIGQSGAPWWGTTDDGAGDLVTTDNSLGEIFANAYAACRMGLVPLPGATWYFNAYEYHPSVRVHRRVCALIAAAAASSGSPASADGWR